MEDKNDHDVQISNYRNMKISIFLKNIYIYIFKTVEKEAS